MYKYIDQINRYINDMLTVNDIKSDAFYKGRIESFFNQYVALDCKDKPLNAINYYDINSYLNSLNNADSEKVNIYNALKRFFYYTYTQGLTSEVVSQIEKPEYNRKPKEVLKDVDYKRLKDYIICKNNKKEIKKRLLLGLFLFTGLSRKYIANLKNCDFIFKEGVYRLRLWKDNQGEVELPLKAELQLVINDYVRTLTENEKLDKLIKIDSNGVSSYVTGICEKNGVNKCNPTILSNTFILKALRIGPIKVDSKC